MIMLSSYEICGVVTLCLLLVAFIYCAYWIGRKQGSESWVDDIVKSYKDTSPYSYKVTTSSEVSDGDPDVAVREFPNFTVYRTGAGSNVDPFPLTIDRGRFLGEEKTAEAPETAKKSNPHIGSEFKFDEWLAENSSVVASKKPKKKAKKKVTKKPRKAKVQ